MAGDVEAFALRGAHLLDPESCGAEPATLLVENGRIAGRLPPDADIGERWRSVDLANHWVSPGFIDLHFHGELFSATPEHFPEILARAARAMLRGGTTAFLATTLAWSRDTLGPFVSALVKAIDAQETEGAACLGLHLEGPWISPEASGAMSRECIRPFDPGRDTEVLDRASGLLRMVTLAPEIEGAAALLDALAHRNVLAALGHTRANDEALADGVARGLRHVTHLFNAMGPMHHRAPGVPGAVLTHASLSADLICDGHHVHPRVIDLASRALGERAVLITDRVDLPGTSNEPGAPARLPDGTLAGSQLSLDLALRNFEHFTGCDRVEAVAACTLRPARLLGVEAERGTLRIGARADLAILDAKGRVMETWLAGKRVFG